MNARLVIFLLLVVLVGCPVKAPVYDYAKEPDPRKTEYVLGPGDALTINVWENEGLTTDTVIRPDGTITMPLVGDLRASGETPTSLRDHIKRRVSDFVKLQGTEVTVAVREANSYRFTLAGEVTRAGVYNSAYYVTVVEAVALAGGFTRFAKRNEITLLRRDAKTGTVRAIPLAYDLLAEGRRPDMNLVVLAGDTLFVP